MIEFEVRSQSKKVSDVELIWNPIGLLIGRRDQIKEFVEEPLVSACEIFYDLNIRTLETSANRRDVSAGFGYIVIDFDLLSERNKMIALRLGILEPDFDVSTWYEEKHNASLLPISINTENVLVEDVRKQAEAIAKQFKKQKPRWSFSLHDLREIDGIAEDDVSKNFEYYLSHGWCLGVDERFYYTEEHYQKSIEEIEE